MVAACVQPICAWLRQQQQGHRHLLTTATPLVVGLCGPQGIGKTTATREICQLLRQQEPPLSAVCLSIDDFYYSRAELRALCEPGGPYSANHLLHGRGLPGTHSLSLGSRTIRHLVDSHVAWVASEGRDVRPVQLPRYDKAACGGAGDRDAACTTVQPPFDIVLLEGWMLGFKSVGGGRERIRQCLMTPHCDDSTVTAMVQVDQLLAEYEREWYPLLDAQILLLPQSLDFVHEWRWEQEETMRRHLGDPKAGMTREQVAAFVDRFMPCYRLYLHAMAKSLDPARSLCLTLDRWRACVVD